MTISRTTKAVPARDGRAPVDAIRFSHPALDEPVRRWTDGTPGSATDTPRCAPVRFLAPAGGDQPTEGNVEQTVHTGQSRRRPVRRRGAESTPRTRRRRAV